jgi:hypothetical protein
VNAMMLGVFVIAVSLAFNQAVCYCCSGFCVDHWFEV